MKQPLTLINILILFLTIGLSSCEKGKLYNELIPNVIEVTLTVTTPKTLEIVYNGKITDTTYTGSFKMDFYLDLSKGNQKLIFREKGSTEVLKEIDLDPKTIKQSYSVIYDGETLYDNSLYFTINGYAMEGELEFLLDGKIIHKGSSKIQNSIPIPINTEQIRKLEVRKVGAQTVLISKDITLANMASHSMKFLFDGTQLIDNIPLDPPKDPNNMVLTMQFKSIFLPSAKGRLELTSTDEIDLVFYTRALGTGNTSRATYETKVSPEIRITFPLNGKFKSIELPPINASKYEYSVDICKKGTDDICYIRGPAASARYPNINQNYGRYGSAILFKKGVNLPLIINDDDRSGITPTPRHYVPIANITDLSSYFN